METEQYEIELAALKKVAEEARKKFYEAMERMQKAQKKLDEEYNTLLFELKTADDVVKMKEWRKYQESHPLSRIGRM